MENIDNHLPPGEESVRHELTGSDSHASFNHCAPEICLFFTFLTVLENRC